MTYAPTTELARRPTVFTDVFGAILSFFTLFGAALRISHAVEARRQPAAADLKILGVNAPLPRPR
jgi:hypothetical protein